MLDVGEQKLAVLLLVMQAQYEASIGLFGRAVTREQLLERRVHMRSVLENLFQTGPRERRAQLLGGLRGNPVVVAVEQPQKVRVKRPVAGEELAEEKRLKEPRRVC